MTIFQTQTFIPSGGNLSVTLPESLWEAEVELFVSKKEKTKPAKLSKDEYLAWVDSVQGTLHSVDYSDIRDETDREL